MKLFLQKLSILVLLLSLFACKQQEVMMFEGENYIQFNKSIKDSLTCSFLSDPDADFKLFPIVMDVVGKPSPNERKVKLSVINELSTANSSHYKIDQEATFRANRVSDTLWVKVFNTPDLKNKAVKIVYTLQNNNDFKVGEFNYSIGVLYFTNRLARPAWWNEDVVDDYLGEYSDKKYQLFIDLTKKVDIDPDNSVEVLECTMLLKNYLLRQKDIGHTVYEEDGTEMEVYFIGG